MYLTEKSRWKEVLSVTFVSRTCLSALYGLFVLKALFIGTLWMFLWFLVRNIAPFFIAFPSHLRHLSITFAALVPQRRRNDTLRHGF